MSPTRLLLVWFAVSFGLAAFWAGAIVLLTRVPCPRRWTEPPDPEAEKLAALERLYNQPAYGEERTR